MKIELRRNPSKYNNYYDWVTDINYWCEKHKNIKLTIILYYAKSDFGLEVVIDDEELALIFLLKFDGIVSIE